MCIADISATKYTVSTQKAGSRITLAILEPAVSILEMSSILTKNRKWPAKTLSNVSRSPLKQPDSPWGIEAIQINILFSRFGYRNKINL